MPQNALFSSHLFSLIVIFCYSMSVEKAPFCESVRNMKDLLIIEGLAIPLHEIEISTRKSGGPGGQHVNKTESGVVVRWNLTRTKVLNDEQKQRAFEKLKNELTHDGDLVITSIASRSQLQNKQDALKRLAKRLEKALRIPKKRIPTSVSAGAQKERIKEKRKQGETKKLRKISLKDIE